jgi:hypothetical protein
MAAGLTDHIWTVEELLKSAVQHLNGALPENLIAKNYIYIKRIIVYVVECWWKNV